MAESAPEQRSRPWRTVTSITLIVLGITAASAVAATITQPPGIIGSPAAGSEVTSSTGRWTPASATAEYGWFRCDASGPGCVAISGACGRSYKVRTADEGHRLRVRLTVTESNGQGAVADSAPTAVVPPPADPAYAQNEPGSDTCVKVTPTGPGQGTFISGTQTGPGTEPAPDTTLPFIDPFPVIRISGRFKGKRTKLTRVTVNAPHGARIRILCKGRGCPYKRKAVAVKLIRVGSLQRTYRPNATIEIRITAPQKIGKYTRVRTRRGKAPVRLDRCLMPGKTRPVRCPAA